jgi:hypothetical protein
MSTVLYLWYAAKIYLIPFQTWTIDFAKGQTAVCALKYEWPLYVIRSRASSVGIATRYGLEGPGIESRWGESFRTNPARLRGPPSLLYNGYCVFPAGKGGLGMMLFTNPLLVPRLRKSWAIPPLTLWVLLGLLRGSLYLYLYLLLYVINASHPK